MKEVTERWIIAFSCILGIPLVAYGMASKNHPVFLLGLGCVVLGYLHIRKKLKRSSYERHE